MEMGLPSVLITGSSGTVGTALAESLFESGYEITGVDVKPNPWLRKVNDHTVVKDLSDDNALSDLNDSFDFVIHLAANARVHKLVKKPVLARENFDMTFTMLEYAREIGADFIFASSREVYGNNGKMIYDETDTYVDECESPYTASKIGGEALVKSYGVCYDIDTNIVRFSNVYGKYDASDRVIPLFIAQANSGQDLTVYGDDKVLDFTYIDDCVNGVTRVIEQFNKAAGTTFNIASGTGTSLLELAELIVQKTESNANIHVDESRTGEVTRYIADISKAEKVLGYDPTFNFEEGLEATVEWYSNRTDIQDTILR